ncbi:MAG: hypothetical protein IPM38_15135 [Ignavibacteria bacterium]|nr:hypothetical protein [Ignavibacteria bacterium]
MDNIPSGKVTFLFTDIQGSTRLAQEDHDGYMISLEKHHEILYDVIDSNNGFVFKIIGDSFCCAFENPKDAVQAAIQSQIRLKTNEWTGPEIKVRMGLHSGDAEFIKNDYAGYVTLSRSQRIMSIAQGGQIIVSQIVHDALQELNVRNVSFKDFGIRKLKDIIVPEHIYQIVSEGLTEDFPPLQTVEARQNNLPSSVSKFIGRRNEIKEIKELFSKIRMLSLTGAGGTGKTRLAIQLVSEILDEFENGVWLLELSPVTDPELILREISTVLNIKEDPGKDLFETVKEFLKEKTILLLFDNCEHLLEKCSMISSELLSTCPKLKIISTSRISFNIPGESIYRIPPLSMPANIKKETYESLAEYESVKFFHEIAKSINSNFSLTKENIYDVAELCKKLDGIPLAIELAAKRINVLSVDKILNRLDDRFRLLTGGSSTAIPRQKTLKAMIDWSYDLLNENEQILLQRLAIFMGGWSLEAAEEICSDELIDLYEVLDLMTSLYDKSLITFKVVNDIGRYDILESIKYYALEKLAGRTEDFKRHLSYYLDLSSFKKHKETGRLEWLNTMETEIDNLRSNIHWATENVPEDAVRMVINVYDFWLSKGYLQEGFESMFKINSTVPVSDKKLHADLLIRISRLCYELGKFEELQKFSNEALELYREINDKEGILKSLNNLALKFYTELDNTSAVKYNEEALALSDEINSKENKADSLYNLSFPVGNLGDFERSIRLKEEALEIARELNNERLKAQALLSLSVTHSRRTGDIKKAAVYSEESLLTSRKIDDRYLISVNLVHLAALKLYYENKNFEEAEYLLLEAHKMSKDWGYNMNLFPIRIHLGVLYTETERFEEAIEIYREYINEIEKPGGEFFLIDLLAGFGRLYFKKNEFGNAIKIFGFIEMLSKDTKYKAINKALILKDEEKNIIKEKIGEEEFNKCRNEGMEMNLEEALDLCLKNE